MRWSTDAAQDERQGLLQGPKAYSAVLEVISRLHHRLFLRLTKSANRLSPTIPCGYAMLERQASLPSVLTFQLILDAL